MIIRDYYEQLHAPKMDSLVEMDKFLEKYNFPKLKQEAERMNNPIIRTEIRNVVNNLLTNKSTGQMKSQGNSNKSLENK